MRWEDRIGRRTKLSDLHILLAVAQCGSMAKAASQLAISHPVISRSISQLEHTLGVRLLERNTRGIELTAFGRAMLDRSRAAFDELRQGVKDIESLTDPTAGEVCVGSTGPLAASFVSAVVDRLSRQYPRIVLHVVIGDTERLHQELAERRVDLLIARKFGQIAAVSVSFEKLYDNPYVIAAGAKNVWARRRKIRLAELINEMWALPPLNSAVGAVVVKAFRAAGLEPPRASVVAFAHEMRINLLATGRYLTVLPSSLLRFPAKHHLIKALPVDMPIVSGPIGVVTLNGRALSPAAQLFINCTREVANRRSATYKFD